MQDFTESLIILKTEKFGFSYILKGMKEVIKWKSKTKITQIIVLSKNPKESPLEKTCLKYSILVDSKEKVTLYLNNVNIESSLYLPL
jgi:hypothetical protein